MFNMMKSLLIMSICMVLIACPEAGSDVRTFCPSTASVDTTDPNAPTVGNTLKTYVDGQKIEYVVSGVRNGVPASGTLTLEWKKHPNLLKPLGSGAPIVVIEEKATLLTQGISTTTYQYIEQNKIDPIFPNDPYKRTTNLWAFGDGGTNYFWFNKDPSALNFVEDLVINSSPVDEQLLDAGNGPISSIFEIYPMTGCGVVNVNCSEKFAQYSETSNLNNKEIVETIQGTFFDAYRIDIPQSTITKIGTSPTTPLPVPLDFKHACGTVNTSLTSSTMWLFPEVGIVKYVIKCNSIIDGSNYNLTYDFNYANFDMPASQEGKSNCS